MQNKFMKAILVSASLLSLAILPSAYAAKKKEAKNYPDCTSRPQVAIDRFKTENISVGWWNDDVALNSREVAVDELVNSGCFTVLEREEGSMAPVGVMNEKALGRSGEARSGSKASKRRNMKVADYLVSYALTGASQNSEGVSVSGLGGGNKIFGGVGVGVSGSNINLQCKVIDTGSGEIVASSRVEAKGVNIGVSATGGSVAQSFGVGNIDLFKKSKVGKMMSNAIHKCSVQLANNMNR